MGWNARVEFEGGGGERFSRCRFRMPSCSTERYIESTLCLLRLNSLTNTTSSVHEAFNSVIDVCDFVLYVVVICLCKLYSLWWQNMFPLGD